MLRIWRGIGFRVIAVLLLLGSMAGCFGDTKGQQTEGQLISLEDDYMISGKPYKVWFDEPAQQNMDGFEHWSLPLGNGYMGINVFGGVDSELISITENSMFNNSTSSLKKPVYGPFGQERCHSNSGGLNLLAKTYIDFAHDHELNYRRELRLNDATACVSYDCEGVTYTREYFASYPDKVTVVRLSASQAGKLSFTLRPEAAYCYEYLEEPGDGMGKTGNVTAKEDTITLSGLMTYYNIRYEGLFKVIPVGGTMKANEKGKGTITVQNADSAIILIAVGTNYRLDDQTFLASEKEKLDPAEDPHGKVQAYLDAAAEKSYTELLGAHRADYTELFDRAQVDLGGEYDDTVTTDRLIADYRQGSRDHYLEEIAFQFGRYLLIASSREGCLPANLQGIWNFGDCAAWSGGYWHNINVQMNYWPAFSTGLAELFQSYVDYNEAMRPKAQANADKYLETIGSPLAAEEGTGENGYAIGTGCNPYKCASPSANGHSGPGTGAFTSLLFWDYYEFTQDEDILKEHTYPAVEGMAKFLSKTLKEYENGKWLVYKSASPENNLGYDSENNKYLYYQTVGSAFDQQMVYANHQATLEAARILGYTEEAYPILAVIKEQIDHLDPVNIGYSGQVKEYREETCYGQIGEEKHRHISQLVGVYPGNVINGTTEAWLEAAAVSLIKRGYTNIGWGKAHRLLCWARIQDEKECYDQVQLMVKEHFANNLFGVYNATNKNNNPFQIDSNFGYTAGVAEMLVQSHAGYIDFLPALPTEWSDGSFRGLTTRGNFAVSAVWSDGIATELVLESRSGGECAVRYPNVAKAVVRDSGGNTVSFTQTDDDFISFATTAGETYTITQIPGHTPGLAAPTTLALQEDGTLRWSEVKEAVSYNVYRAVEDAPNYELLAQGLTDRSYTYASGETSGKRVTLRVTAVSADGTESQGVTAVLAP